MILSLDVQLQVALRALEEVVAPALSQSEKHVMEQLQLAIATIGFVKTRLPDARRYARMETSHFARLGQDVAECAGDEAHLSALVREARAMLDDPAAEVADYDGMTSRLRSEIAALGSRCGDPEKRKAIDGIVLRESAALLGQARQWTSPFGFELKPEDLPPPAW